MLDSGIARMGLFAFIFLICFAGILSLMPTGLVSNVKVYGNPANAIPDTWYGTSLKAFNFTDYYNTTLISNGLFYESFKTGNREMALQYNHALGLDQGWIRLYYRYGLGLLFHEDMIWFDADGIRVSWYYELGMKEIFDTAHMLSEFNSGKTTFTVKCLGKGGAWIFGSSSFFYVTAILGWNTTAYDTPNEAWINDDLQLLIGINPKNVSFVKDVWFIITNLMAFNTAEVFGASDFISVTLNWIACSFIYGAIIIFASAIALEILPEWL